MTKSDVINSIEPSKLSASIENITNKKDDAITITCIMKKLVIKVEQEIKKNVGDKYSTLMPSFKTPRIMIYGLDEKLLETIIKNQVIGVFDDKKKE